MTTTTFTWDIAAGIPMLLDDGDARYVSGASGRIAQIDSSDTYYYLGDGLGSVMKTTDDTGAVVNSYEYDVYGAVTSSSGSQANEFEFAGEQTDPSGLQFLRARYYDPETGTFISRDPLSAMPGWASVRVRIQRSCRQGRSAGTVRLRRTLRRPVPTGDHGAKPRGEHPTQRREG